MHCIYSVANPFAEMLRKDQVVRASDIPWPWVLRAFARPTSWAIIDVIGQRDGRDGRT